MTDDTKRSRMQEIVRLIEAAVRIPSLILCYALLGGLIASVFWTVFSRYAMNDASAWAFELSYMSAGALFMLGTAYALQMGAIIRTDFLRPRFSLRVREGIELVGYLCFFFPAMAAMFWLGLDAAVYSWSIEERSNITAARPMLFGFKAAVPLAAALLMLQGVAETLKSLIALRTGETVRSDEAVEV